MNKAKGNFFSGLLMIAGIFATALLLYVFLLEEVKLLSKQKADQLAVLEEKGNKIKQRIVDIQKLSTKERIVQIAQDELEMVVISEFEDTIRLEARKVDNIQGAVEKKYE